MSTFDGCLEGSFETAWRGGDGPTQLAKPISRAKLRFPARPAPFRLSRKTATSPSQEQPSRLREQLAQDIRRAGQCTIPVQ